MKNVFFALAFMLVGTFAFAESDKKTSTATFNEDLGTCHIVIVNNQTGETEVDVKLPANSAEACEAMLEATLEALNK